MIIDFIEMKKANNGQWVIEYSVDNGLPELKWLTNFEALLIKSAQRAARNEVRDTIKKTLMFERPDGRTPV